MSLAKCPNCGESCSTLAIDCPHCNRPLGFNNSEKDESKIKMEDAVDNSVIKNSNGGVNSKTISIIAGVVGVMFIIYWYSGQPKMSNLRYEHSDIQWVETGNPTVGEGWRCGGFLIIVLALVLPMIIDKNSRK